MLLQYALVDDPWEQTSLRESEADTGSNKLSIPKNGKFQFSQQRSALTVTYASMNPMDNLEKKRVSFGGLRRKVVK